MINQNKDFLEDSIIRVAIVDDHLVLLDALRMIVQNQKDMVVVGTAGNCADCLDLVERATPDVLLLDVMMPDGNGISLVPVIKRIAPEVNVLILTSLSDEAVLIRAMQAGVSGFLSKNLNLTEVLRGIRQTASGEIAIPTSLMLGLFTRASHEKTGPALPVITHREREILTLLSEGKRPEDIAQRLCISPYTIRTHIRNLMQKMGAHSQLQAVTLAVQNGLIDPPA